jgi:hypothetical protein
MGRFDAEQSAEFIERIFPECHAAPEGVSQRRRPAHLPQIGRDINKPDIRDTSENFMDLR